MSAKVLTPAQANLELFILSSEAEAMSSSDFYAWLKERGLSDEAAIRLKAVAEITAEVGKRVINVGKMILIKIMEFVKAHAHLAIGIAIGAAIGALVGAIPWIGWILSPVATLIGVSAGALAGHRLDKADVGTPQNSGLVAIGQDIIEIATAFFKLLVDILTLTLDAKVLRGI
jgi:ElaB/YqjD/DUF883 family membrane-anchored ribosome-binding protein